jgi:hypothetical protein
MALPMITTDMFDNEEFDIVLSEFKNGGGETIPAPPTPSWAKVSGSGNVNLIPSADGLSCEVEGLTPGIATVSATVGPQQQQYQITIKSSAVTTFRSTLGPKRPKT